MATSNEAGQSRADAEEHVRSYRGIMTAMSHVGVPASMALAMFFTMLTMGTGLWAVVGFAVVYLFVWWVVKTFFSAH